MRVTHVLYGGLGGHATVVFDLIQGSGLRESLVLLSPKPPLGQHTDLANQLGVHWVWVRANGKSPLYPLQILRDIRSQRPDVIVVHSAGAALLALAAGALPRGPAVIYVEHHSWPLRDRTMNLASAAALSTAAAVVTLSEDYAVSLRNRFPRRRHTHIHVIPNGVDTTKFHPAPSRNPVGIGSATVLVGMQSRITPIKDHRTLLHAMKHLMNEGVDVRLQIAGDGPELPALRRLSDELGLDDHVEFLGLLSADAVVDFLQSLDIYVHATLGEASSTAILQAMAVGLPVVASKVSGVEGMVPPEAGSLVPVRDSVALAEAISAYAESPRTRASAGASAREHVTFHHDIVRIRERFVTLLLSVATPRSSTTRD